MNAVRKLEKARRKRTFVDIERNHKRMDRVWGYVLAVGTEWVLVAAAREGGYPDGLMAVRVEDIGAVRKRSGFEGTFAASRTDWPTPPANLDLDSTKRLLRSAGKLFPLVGIEREKKVRSALWIGVPVFVDRSWTWMHEIRPDASWHDEPLGYKTRTITCVHLGGGYQDALAAVMPPRPPERIVRVKKRKKK